MGEALRRAAVGQPLERNQYAMLPLERRQKVAGDCLKGQNQHRERYAREIIEGDLWESSGYPRHYWHCLATVPPEAPRGRRGQWKAAEMTDLPMMGWGWAWQDWGPSPCTPTPPGQLPQFWQSGEPEDWGAFNREPTWEHVPSEELIAGLLAGYRRHSGGEQPRG